MTILQLKVAASVAELKSVTGAARLLNISQPNASNSLKLLEEELGFPIFLRTGGGVTVTPKGTEFLLYARQMLEANEKALKLRNAEEIYQFRLGTVNYSVALEPFYTLCNEHREDEHCELRCCSVTVSEGIRALTEYRLDVVAAPIMKHQVAGTLRECKNAGLEMTSIGEIPSVIIVRKNHPSMMEKNYRKITQGCDLMKNYPYVGLRQLDEDASSIAYNDSDYIQCSYKMFADDTTARLRLIEATNGFGFGLPSAFRLKAQFALEFYPVKDVAPDLFCLTRTGESERPEIREYITLLKKETLKLLK